MVHKKVLSRHGIQADHVKKSEKLLGNLKKPTSCQHQDGKNRGPDMKKKMKRLRSIKLSDIQSFKTSPLRKPMSQPGKPPPPDGPTPQKQPVIKATDDSPNYMRSTSCSEARKENSHSQSQVSSSGSEKLSSSARNKSRTLTKSSSLKLVRTLTKSPSFKPTRGTARKSSRVVLCTDTNVQKATCSSTLKDSKFPAYLMLNPGGTEAEGTSATKVCPYTYCSLNGHHHSPMPPLKCFLKARRRSLKTQKSIKSNDLSPNKPNLSSGGMEEMDCGARGFPGEEPAHYEADSVDLVHSPTVRDLGMGFFIEIYAKNNLPDAESPQGSTSEIVGQSEEQSNKYFYRNEEPVPEEIKDEYDESPFTWSEELVTTRSFDRNETERECTNMEDEDNISEVTDMEWEEVQSSASELDAEADHLNKFKEFGDKISDLSELEKPLKFDEFEEILTDDVLQELFQEETYSFDPHEESNDIHERENDVSDLNQLQDYEIHCLTDSIPDIFVHHQEDISLQADDATQNQVDADQDAETMAIGFPTTDQELHKCEIGDAIEYQEHIEDVKSLVGSQISYSSRSFSEVEPDDSEVDNSQDQITAETFQIAEADGDGELSNYFNDESDPDELHNVVQNQDILEEDQVGASQFKIHTSVDSEQNTDSRMYKINLDNNSYTADVEKIEDEDCFKLGTTETLCTDNEGTGSVSHCAMPHFGSNFEPELASTCSKRKWTIQSKKPIKDSDEQREFNPKEPNFLPVVPDPEAEKVDLKHQDMDDRKNSEEWMIDYALQKAVTKLAPARKKKVALLVEAFETVLPMPTFKTLRRHSSPFPQSRPVQACS
ncbi:hypothetical protein K2173_014617 [Erythroxylum novogranatense]|uniref:Calmodulin-binding domain-containing protein n=1 Tax=Erythroxylum novogranatense TaxID=1862640 RepID=A0AAV8THG6_9ROSI|nr:hypothetical protein K2173_014617 [Erythroxylum novogranatense]